MPTHIKAKSRLIKIEKTEHNSAFCEKKVRNSKDKSEFISQYLHHLPTLLLSVIFYGITFAVLNKISPSSTKNLLFPNSYLLFQLPFLLGNFFLFSFLFLNAKRGVFISMLIFVFLFLKMQGVVL
jgi:hypothetical protein